MQGRQTALSMGRDACGHALAFLGSCAPGEGRMGGGGRSHRCHSYQSQLVLLTSKPMGGYTPRDPPLVPCPLPSKLLPTKSIEAVSLLTYSSTAFADDFELDLCFLTLRFRSRGRSRFEVSHSRLFQNHTKDPYQTNKQKRTKHGFPILCNSGNQGRRGSPGQGSRSESLPGISGLRLLYHAHTLSYYRDFVRVPASTRQVHWSRDVVFSWQPGRQQTFIFPYAWTRFFAKLFRRLALAQNLKKYGTFAPNLDNE